MTWEFQIEKWEEISTRKGKNQVEKRKIIQLEKGNYSN